MYVRSCKVKFNESFFRIYITKGVKTVNSKGLRMSLCEHFPRVLFRNICYISAMLNWQIYLEKLRVKPADTKWNNVAQKKKCCISAAWSNNLKSSICNPYHLLYWREYTGVNENVVTVRDLRLSKAYTEQHISTELI